MDQVVSCCLGLRCFPLLQHCLLFCTSDRWLYCYTWMISTCVAFRWHKKLKSINSVTRGSPTDHSKGLIPQPLFVLYYIRVLQKILHRRDLALAACSPAQHFARTRRCRRWHDNSLSRGRRKVATTGGREEEPRHSLAHSVCS